MTCLQYNYSQKLNNDDTFHEHNITAWCILLQYVLHNVSLIFSLTGCFHQTKVTKEKRFVQLFRSSFVFAILSPKNQYLNEKNENKSVNTASTTKWTIEKEYNAKETTSNIWQWQLQMSNDCNEHLQLFR